MVCIIEDCERTDIRARRLCQMHYDQARRGRSQLPPLLQPQAPAERFWRKVSQAGDCWLWAASLTGGGYGKFYVGGQTVYAHRWAYEYMVAPIPDGLQLDHLCRNRACVNPEHLDPVTQAVNIRRGKAPSAVLNQSGTCSRGHSMDDAYLTSGGRHQCRPCKSARAKKYYWRERGVEDRCLECDASPRGTCLEHLEEGREDGAVDEERARWEEGEI